MLKLLILLLYFPVTLSGQLFMKSASSLMSLTFVAGGVLYCLGAALWLYVLRLFPISFAFPLAAGILIVGTQFMGYFFFQEKLDTSHFFAIGVIILGLCLLAFSGQNNLSMH